MPGLPDIQLTRPIEEDEVVVAEGAVQAALKDGGRIDALFAMSSTSERTRSAAW
jgi:hypothetical protein